MSQGSSLPKGHAVHPASHRGSDGVSFGMEIEAFDKSVGADELPIALAAGAVDPDGDRFGRVALRVETVEVGPGVVDDLPTVGVREAGIEILAVGVAGETPSSRGAGVEVAGALMVGHKINTRSDPHRRSEVRFKFYERAEGAIAGAVDPQCPGGTSPVSFPAGWIV